MPFNVVTTDLAAPLPLRHRWLGRRIAREQGMDDFAGIISNALELTALATIVAGALSATVQALRELSSVGADSTYRGFRKRFGRAIILSLEFLVAADIIGTVAIEPSFRNIGVLAAIVGVRTFLSFSIELETEGRWPWEAS